MKCVILLEHSVGKCVEAALNILSLLEHSVGK